MDIGIATYVLTGFALLSLLHVGTQSLLLKASVGNAWTMGARDTAVQPGALAGRATRALHNFLETTPTFLVLMLAAHVAQRGGIWIEVGAGAYLAGRFVYLPAYVSGVPYLRSAAWLVATIGLVLMLGGVVFP
ncbi:MAPEG family protein [Pararhodobacter sp. SW119]|uniref:MAPEG family protein n=1 Tax=Pararhodobacter sp. SW119 TaxID=2780075 RepID=UPI001AE0D058|nr:MAPEG family protein [Pararhodobacter sp. SW119]